MHYGVFAAGPLPSSGRKRGFCLESIQRSVNAEWSPIDQPYWTCSFQGIAPGWYDSYNAGLPCQWLDVTDSENSTRGVSTPVWLSQQDNPDGFLCEGTPVTDVNGSLVWETTTFTTALGEPVYRPQCIFNAGWSDDNSENITVMLLPSGSTYVQESCLGKASTTGTMGPKRDCGFGFDQSLQLLRCTPGESVIIHATVVPTNSDFQVVRVCLSSHVLQAGTGCNFNDSIANVIVPTGGAVTVVQFTCPLPLDPSDASEPGGLYSIYSAPLFSESPLDVTAINYALPKGAQQTHHGGSSSNWKIAVGISAGLLGVILIIALIGALLTHFRK